VSAPALRLVTAAAVIAVCGWSVAEGARRLAYEFADADGKREFLDTPGLGQSARAFAMRRAVAAGGAPTIDDLEGLLARAPLAGDVWLDLAAARLAAGRPFAEVEKALAMAHLSAPREAREMLRRATFGLAHWQAFAPATRARLAADLARGFAYASGPERLALAALATTALPSERLDLAARLAARGEEGEPALRALGLDAAPP
jgi:hypothetical protein